MHLIKKEGENLLVKVKHQHLNHFQYPFSDQSASSTFRTIHANSFD